MLIIFGGLPGTGKTTLSKEIAKHFKAAYLRVDTIEQTLKNMPDHSAKFAVEEAVQLIINFISMHFTDKNA